MKKRILGLDLGTNSIGWALIEIDHENCTVRIIGLGSRILPMDSREIGDFESSGKIKSVAAQRTEKRGPRRQNERYLLRRDRLHLVLNLLDALPNHYKLEIDFVNKKGEKSGKFKTNQEPKLAYLPKQNGKKAEFLFKDSYQEMLDDINDTEINNAKGRRIPYDWTLYYLRQKALKEKISLEELAWVLLSYNQKRGYEKTEVLDKSTKANEIIEELDLRVKNVIESKDKEGKKFFEIHLDGNDGFVYHEYSDTQMTFENDLKEVIKITEIDDDGNIKLDKTTKKEQITFKIIDIYPLTITDVHYEKVNGKHRYTLTYDNGWIEAKNPLDKFTFKYKNALDKTFDYIVETVYDISGNIKTQQGKERKFREPDFGEKSSDWTLLKKKTEKELLAFNAKKEYIEDGNTKNYISPKIYDILKNDAKTGNKTRIIGGMFQVVDRSFYREELNDIIKTQKQFHTVLADKEIFEKCVETLYPKNKTHQDTLLKNKNAIQHLLTEDILLYHRPLKSKKSEIANCKYEVKYWEIVKNKEKDTPITEIDTETGEIKTKKKPVYLKVVAASHPYFQEFRIWDKLHNLKLIQLSKEINGKTVTNQDVTKEYFKSEKDYQELFDEINNKKSFTQSQFLNYCKRKFKVNYNSKNSNYTWNFPEDDEIKGNETRVSFATRFKRCGFTNYTDFLTQQKEMELWHYLYSVSYLERSKNKNKSVITFFDNFFKDFDINEDTKAKIINDFANYPQFASQYCSFSEKALKKLIPLMNLGENKNKYTWMNESSYQNWQNTLEIRKSEIINKVKSIDFTTDNIDYSVAVRTNVDLQNGEIPFPKGLFNAFKEVETVEDFTGLNLTKASYLVYGRHSELAFAKHWLSPKQIRDELHQELKQHSLNNPVAEKVLLEMMQIVADIWEFYGEGQERFFSQINLEVGRELRKSAKEKEADSKRMSGNRSQNKRLRQVLEEFLVHSPYNANPRNSDHFERLKIAEEGANLNNKFFEDNKKLKEKKITKKDIDDILKKTKISKEDFEKYKLWIEQGYCSPYSGQMIGLNELFDGEKYNIDHIFPQASVTNDSLNNKVVVEVALNKLKGNKTGRDFIQQQQGQSHLGIPVLTEEKYLDLVEKQFSGTKRKILLAKDIPKGFTDSQLNTSKHIARKAMELLSHIVRERDEVEYRSKHVLPVTGEITAKLKRAWRLDEVWTELVSPRFIRLNELTQSNLFGSWQISKNGQRYFDCDLDKSLREKDESYDIKRIDHRHHALDALIVALCTQEHVNYINNINADAKSDDYDKQKQIEKYRETLKREIKFTTKHDEKDDKNWHYMLPGAKRIGQDNSSGIESVLKMNYYFKDFENFGSDYKQMILNALGNTIVTFKQNLRVVNKRVNYYQASPNAKAKIAQQPKTFDDISTSSNKYNWGIRRSLGKDTFYGKQTIEGEEKIVIRKNIDTSFDSSKIKTISDVIGFTKAILINQLKQFDTVELPFDEAILYLDALLEKEEFEAIVNDSDNKIQSIEQLINHLQQNNYKFKTSNFKNLNVFIDKISARDFRNEAQYKKKIKEHPEIAFTPEAIVEMNKYENLKKLNGGKEHKPIKKVKITRGFGKQRPVSEDKASVKSKQFIVTDAGSNLYLGFYERVYKDVDGNDAVERKFEDIGLIELIETLKQDITKRKNPLPEKIYDNNNSYSWKFTLSPNDLVYVPTEEEIENPSLVNIHNLTKEQFERIYKYVDGNIDIANFIPYSVAKPIWRFHGNKNGEIHKELSENNKLTISLKELIQNEFGLGSQQNKSQNMIDGKTQIKKICWKLEINRLGEIINHEK